jgi:hypothetical protein
MFTENRKKVIFKMLNEFENQITFVMDKYNDGTISYEECIANLKKITFFWDFSRIDLKNRGNSSNSIHFLEYEKGMNVSFPKWFEDEKGKGCIIESKIKKFNLIFRCLNDGNLDIFLRGVDFRNILNERIPIYVCFTNLSINTKKIFTDDRLIWHNQPYKYSKKCEDGEIINLNVEFMTIYDLYPILGNFFTNIIDNEDLYSKIDSFNKFIENQKIILDF